jgi:hypothetical protein
VRSGHVQRWRQMQGYIVPRRDGGWGWSVTRWERADDSPAEEDDYADE